MQEVRPAMDVRILLIAKKGADRDRYLKAVQALGVEVTVVSSFRRIDREAAKRTYHGVMVDLHTKIKALRESRDFVYEILGQFPLVQLKIDRKRGEIRAFHPRRNRGESLEDFIRRECLAFSPRRFRLHPRKKVHFNTRLFRHGPGGTEKAERTVTMNLSCGGCFIFTVASWRPGQPCWVVFQELADRTPIRCEVRHVVDWGTRLRVPGIGVEFTDIRAGQADEIEKGFLQVRNPYGDTREAT